MSENPKLEARLRDLERRHDRTRKLLVDALSLSVVLSALLVFRPGGVGTFVVGFGGAFVVPSILDRWFLDDRLPGETSPYGKGDPAFDRWCVIAAATGLLVLIATVAAFVIRGIVTIHSAG
ncbi:MAG TPA: hypothetical protein VMM15_42330 [Bradyrhizobium sp.]|nr:hypothetical protein [Bradyrhizobium sp.]